MQQLDLFSSDPNLFLYTEIEKIRTSLDKRSRAMFALISELQDEIVHLRQKKEEPHENAM